VEAELLLLLVYLLCWGWGVYFAVLERGGWSGEVGACW
jgi:hypothetical protein